MKTETGKLMSSGRLTTEQQFKEDKRKIDYLFNQTREFNPQIEISALQSKVDDLHGTCVRQQELLDNQHRLILLCLSMLQVLHPSELHQGLKAHPDNLATMVHLGLEQERKD